MPRKTKTAPAEPAEEIASITPLARTYALVDIPLADIEVGANVRADAGDLTDLTASIAARGVLEPVGVHRDGDRYVLEYGQRRYLASVQAGRDTIPALVIEGTRDAGDVSIDQLVENVHRADLNPIELATGIRAIVDASPSLRQVDVAAMLGMAPSSVSNLLRLLELEPTVQTSISAGTISKSHGKALAALPVAHQKTIADRVERDAAAGRPMSSHELESEIRWRTESAEKEARREAREAKFPAEVAELLAGVPAGTPIALEKSYTPTKASKAVARVVANAGFTITEVDRFRVEKRGPKCKCTTLLVDLSRKPKLAEVCVVEAHQRAETKAAEVDRTAERATRKRRAEALEAALAHAVSGLSDSILRGLAWRTEYYGTEIMAETRDQLIARITRSPIHDGYVSNPTKTDEMLLAMLAALGVEDPGPEPVLALQEPATGRKRKARTEPAVAVSDGTTDGSTVAPEPVILPAPGDAGAVS